MEIKVYHSQLFANENSILEVLDKIIIEKDVDGMPSRKNVYPIGEETTLKKLYSEGWRLKKVVSAHNSNTNFFFFMEK